MIKDIQKLICQYYKIDLLSLKSRCRRQEICHPRSIAIYLCREYTKHTLAFIGIAFNRKHPVVLHSYQRIKRRLEGDRVLRNEIDFLTQRIPLEGNERHKDRIKELEDEFEEIMDE